MRIPAVQLMYVILAAGYIQMTKKRREIMLRIRSRPTFRAATRHLWHTWRPLVNQSKSLNVAIVHDSPEDGTSRLVSTFRVRFESTVVRSTLLGRQLRTTEQVLDKSVP